MYGSMRSASVNPAVMTSWTTTANPWNCGGASSDCSWQKGDARTRTSSSGNTYPKKENFNRFTDAYIMKVQKKINARPREKLNFNTPKSVFFNSILLLDSATILSCSECAPSRNGSVWHLNHVYLYHPHCALDCSGYSPNISAIRH